MAKEVGHQETHLEFVRTGIDAPEEDVYGSSSIVAENDVNGPPQGGGECSVRGTEQRADPLQAAQHGNGMIDQGAPHMTIAGCSGCAGVPAQGSVVHEHPQAARQRWHCSQEILTNGGSHSVDSTHVEVFVEAGDEVAGLGDACGASDEIAVRLQWSRSTCQSPSGHRAMHPVNSQISGEFADVRNSVCLHWGPLCTTLTNLRMVSRMFTCTPTHDSLLQTVWGVPQLRKSKLQDKATDSRHLPMR